MTKPSGQVVCPSLGRFAQADAIVPGGVQGLDRYAYVNNNPVRYTDPTGYCSKGNEDYDLCKEQLKYVEKRYTITVKDSKYWTIETLQAIQNGMAKLRNALGVQSFAKLFTGVIFEYGGGNVASNGMGTTGHSDVHLGIDLDLSDSAYITQETVHELAHIWDNSCHDCMSNGMMKITGSYITKKWSFLGIGFGPDIYHPMGGPPPSGYPATMGVKGGEEDWAESVTHYLMSPQKSASSFSWNDPWSQLRQDYVRDALAGPIP